MVDLVSLAGITITTNYIIPYRSRGHRTVLRKRSLDGPFAFAAGIDGKAPPTVARRGPTLCTGSIDPMRPFVEAR